MVEQEPEIKFEKPKGAGEAKKVDEIHVMPERFRGVTLEAKIPKEVPTPGLRGPLEPTKPAKPVKAKKPPKAPRMPGEKKFPWLVVIIIFVILAALGVSIFLVLQGFQLPTERAEAPEEEQLVVEEPTPPPAVEEEPEEEEEPEFATTEVSIPATPEVSIPATSEVSVPIEPGEPPVVVYTGGVDADSDGLTDVEEGLFNTDERKPDTDSDGFLDGNEVYHLYNPGGTAPVTLLESGLVKDHINSEHGYIIYYPAAWRSEISKGLVMFTASSGELVQVLIEENPSDLSLEDWYRTQAPGVDDEDLKAFTTKSGIEGLQSPDRLTAYFKRDSKIFIVSLNLGAKTVIEFRRTYEMMLNSFKFLE